MRRVQHTWDTQWAEADSADFAGAGIRLVVRAGLRGGRLIAGTSCLTGLPRLSPPWFQE